jgi:hypothetical protein
MTKKKKSKAKFLEQEKMIMNIKKYAEFSWDFKRGGQLYSNSKNEHYSKYIMECQYGNSETFKIFLKHCLTK